MKNLDNKIPEKTEYKWFQKESSNPRLKEFVLYDLESDPKKYFPLAEADQNPGGSYFCTVWKYENGGLFPIRSYEPNQKHALDFIWKNLEMEPIGIPFPPQ